MKYIPVIGLEIHVQLATDTKMFCDSLNDPDESKPNINVCPVCLGHPGTLPVPNQQAIEFVIKAGLALKANIAAYSQFDRKHYFYPDLPKAYQISQYQYPLCTGGRLRLTNKQTVRIRRIHLEEDTGRLIHPAGGRFTLIDFNRAGVPLMELVTEPDLHSATDARAFCEELQLIFRYLNIARANMEKGEMRCEVNISLQPENAGRTEGWAGTKVEIKNLNSFRAVERAAAYEISRQKKQLAAGDRIKQETRGWDEVKGRTVAQRSKEEAHDYRYFPEPDIPPIIIYATRAAAKKNQSADKVVKPLIAEVLREQLPELPNDRRARYARQYRLNTGQIEIFTRNKTLGEYFEKTASDLAAWLEAEGEKLTSIRQEKLFALAANYLITNLVPLLTEKKIAVTLLKMTPENFAELIKMTARGELSSTAAKIILEQMLEQGGDPSDIAQSRNLLQESGPDQLAGLVEKIIRDNPSAAADYQNGNQKVIQFLIGKIMQASKGKANPKVAAELLKTKLQK